MTTGRSTKTSWTGRSMERTKKAIRRKHPLASWSVNPSPCGDGWDFSGNQEGLCAGLGGDQEDEHDGAEPNDGDDEPSAGHDVGEPNLGWTVDGCMTGLSDDR